MAAEPDELGTHVSAAGGVAHSQARAAAPRSAVLQVVTKQPGRATPTHSPRAGACARRRRGAPGNHRGLGCVRLFHLNDSVAGLGAGRDRHAHIGEGALGMEAFRRLLRAERLRDIPKLLKTPKDGDALRADRRNLR